MGRGLGRRGEDSTMFKERRLYVSHGCILTVGVNGSWDERPGNNKKRRTGLMGPAEKLIDDRVDSARDEGKRGGKEDKKIKEL